MLTISNDLLSADSAPTLNNLISFGSEDESSQQPVHDEYQPEVEPYHDWIGPADEADAFPIMVSEAKEAIQTINPD